MTQENNETMYEDLNHGEEENINEPSHSHNPQFYSYGYNDFATNKLTDESFKDLQRDEVVFLTFFASLLLLFDSINYEGWSITLISLVSIVVSALLINKAKALTPAVTLPDEHVSTVAIGLHLMWILSLLHFTTASQYRFISLGYLMIWLATLSSFHYAALLNKSIEALEVLALRLKGKNEHLFYIMISAFVGFFSSFLSCTFRSSTCGSNSIFVIFISILTTGACIYLLLSDVTRKVRNASTELNSSKSNQLLTYASLSFFISWTLVVTFSLTKKPFYEPKTGATVGNAFFSSWICLVHSGIFLRRQLSSNTDTPLNNEERTGSNLFV